MKRSNNQSQPPHDVTISQAIWPPTRRLLAIAVQVGVLGLVGAGQVQAQQAAPATAVSQGQPLQAMHDFNIAAQSLATAIAQFSSQTGADVFTEGVSLNGLASPGVNGRLSLNEGLQQLLAGTGVGFRYQPQSQSARPTIHLLAQGQALELAPISVHGTPAGNDGEWVYQEPRSVSVITREQIDKRPPRHAADMLADAPGVTSAVDRHNPALSVNIRGMQDFGRVNMMIDGMRQNHVESGHQQRNGEMYIDSELLSSVVVEKGPNAGLYGANAIAGSANFRTLDYDDIILPGQDHGVRLRAGTGIGGYANGVHFQGSAAVAGRFSDRLELLFARSQKNLGAYDIGDRGRQWGTSAHVGGQQEYSQMQYSDQKQDSWLAKARVQLTDEQSLQFSYIGTDISYNNTSDWDWNSPNGYRTAGAAEATSDAYSLEYAFSPDNPLIDLKAQLYFVSTENQRITEGRSSPMIDMYWDFGMCLGETLDRNAMENCLAGMRKNDTSRTDTWGLQFENTSIFEINMPGAELSANYGIEWFQDEGKSSNKADRDGVTTPFLSELTGSNLNPNGLRDVASAFASLTFEKDPFTLKAGLRYDWYHQRGETTVPGTESKYLDRFSSFMNYQCSRNSAAAQQACAAGRDGGEAGAIAWTQSVGQDEDYYYTTSRYAPQWIDEEHRHDYDIDRSQGKLSPFLSAAYKPLDWLELFGNWGKGFRPPAMTETLWEGTHPGGGSSKMFPNPLLDPERSTSWEVGFNILRQNLLRDNDRLGLKLAYFNTKVDQFMYSSLGKGLPGENIVDLSNVFFVNNLETTRFRGLELDTRYDAGLWYAGANMTRYISGENDFCSKSWPLGNQVRRYDQPNEDGSMTEQHIGAIEAGYGSYQEMMDARVQCGIGGVMNATRAMPMDRHGAHFGVRLFNRTLDMGIRYNRSEGDAPSNYASSDQQMWDSYTTWDAYARYQPVETFAVSIAVENIRDENYLSGYSDMFTRTYAPGRTVQAGLELRF